MADDKLVAAMARAIEGLNPTWKDAEAEARAALAAVEGAGWRVVPAEPTLDMAVAGCERLREFYPDDPDANHRAASYAYVAMLAAAPPPEGRT